MRVPLEGQPHEPPTPQAAQTCTWETLFKIQTSARSNIRKVLNSVESLGKHLTWKRLSADDLDLVMTTSNLRGDDDCLSRAGPKQIAHRVRSSARTPSRSTFLKASAGKLRLGSGGLQVLPREPRGPRYSFDRSNEPASEESRPLWMKLKSNLMKPK